MPIDLNSFTACVLKVSFPVLLPLCLFTLTLNATVAPACDKNASFITLRMSVHSCHKGVVFLVYPMNLLVSLDRVYSEAGRAVLSSVLFF